MEVHFLYFTSIITLLFDAKIVSVCKIHTSDMRNAFVLDDRHGVKAYLRKLKGVLLALVNMVSDSRYFGSRLKVIVDRGCISG